MSEVQTEPEIPKSELEIFWNTDIPHPRDGIETSFVFITPSNKETKGFSALKVEHVKLTQKEASTIGLPDRNEPYKVTYLFLDPHGTRSDDISIWKTLISTNTDEESTHTSERSFQAIRDTILPQSIKDRPDLISMERNGSTIDDSEKTTPQDMLNEAVSEHPDKEICILMMHGTVNNLYSNQNDRLVGSPSLKDNLDYISYLLNSIDISQYSAVLDQGCSSETYIPSQNIQKTHTLYIASQAETPNQIATRGDQKLAHSCVMLKDGDITRFDWKNKLQYVDSLSRSQKVAISRQPRLGLIHIANQIKETE